MFTDTKLYNAHYYLNDRGAELEREHWVKELFVEHYLYDNAGWMIYVGEGFVPLAVAVIAQTEPDAYDVFGEWCQAVDREEELFDEDGNTVPYIIQKCPIPTLEIPRIKRF